ncbi:hypothetical protein ACFL5F_01190 [Planctomycetota bacterium]
MRKKEICILLLAVSFLLLSGCSVRYDHKYHGLNLELKSEGSAKIAVATHDQRSYIVSGNKKPDFAGIARGQMYQPFNVTTASRNSFADDITDTITHSLKSKGFNSIGVIVRHSDNDGTIKATLKRENASRSIVTTLYEWKSDIYMHRGTSLWHDVRMQVLDAAGNTIGEKRISEESTLSPSDWNAWEHSKKTIPAALVKTLETLLNSKEISDALIGAD